MIDPERLITDAEQLQGETLEWGGLKWLCNERLSPGAAQTLGLCFILPGKRNPLHYHPNCEEILHVLSGHGKHSVAGKWCDLKPGITLRVPAGVEHNVVNDGWEPLVCVIAFSCGERETVFLE